jgi:hypothetical protein
VEVDLILCKYKITNETNPNNDKTDIIIPIMLTVLSIVLLDIFCIITLEEFTAI